jgi:hypothetical protein
VPLRKAQWDAPTCQARRVADDQAWQGGAELAAQLSQCHRAIKVAGAGGSPEIDAIRGDAQGISLRWDSMGALS